MTIKVACASCHSQFAANPHLYGKTVACPNCRAAITVPEPSRATDTFAPPDTVDHFATPQPTQTAAQSHPGYRPQPAETGMDGMDRKVLWYSVAGAGGILLLLVGAIAVSRLLSGGGEPSVADVKAAAETDSLPKQATMPAEVATGRLGETGAQAASPVREPRSGALDETMLSKKSQRDDETANHTPATSTDAPFVRKFSDLSDRERKAFIDDFKARFNAVYREASAVAGGGSQRDLSLVEGKLAATVFVVMADHRIEPTELYRHVEYGRKRGQVQLLTIGLAACLG